MSTTEEDCQVKKTRSGKARVARSRKTTERIKWTEEMEKAILEYGKEGIRNGLQFEKPSAPDFYKKFLESAIGFDGVPVDKLVQHMRNLKRCYTSALEWRGKTGQGILDEDPLSGVSTVESELLKRCKYFKELDEILGDKPQFNPPFQLHSALNDPVADGAEIEIENPDVNESELFGTGLYGNESNEENVQAIDKVDVVIDVVTPPVPPKRARKSPVKSAAAALESAMHSKIVLDEKRLEWEKEKVENQKIEAEQRVKAEMDFKMLQLEFERQKWNDELAQRKCFEDQRYDIEILKVEKEADLARFKVEKEFELEKYKLGLGSS